MTDAIITGPGLYVLRNGIFVVVNAIGVKTASMCVGHVSWFVQSGMRVNTSWTDDYDIIRRATPEEAAKF